MIFNPIKTSHEHYCIGTIPNKLTHYKQNVYNFSLRYYLLYKLPETEIKLVRRMFYGQEVSISKFKFLLSSLVLHCYLLSNISSSSSHGLPTGIIKRLKHIRQKPHVYVIMEMQLFSI